MQHAAPGAQQSALAATRGAATVSTVTKSAARIFFVISISPERANARKKYGEQLEVDETANQIRRTSGADLVLNRGGANGRKAEANSKASAGPMRLVADRAGAILTTVTAVADAAHGLAGVAICVSSAAQQSCASPLPNCRQHRPRPEQARIAVSATHAAIRKSTGRTSG